MIQTKLKKMAGVNLHFETSIESTLNGFLLQLLRSSVVEITLSLDTETILLFFSISATNSDLNRNFSGLSC